MAAQKNAAALAGADGVGIVDRSAATDAPNSTAPAPDQERLIAAIAKNSRERIAIALRSYKGHRFVDIRVQFADGGEWRPTGKGVGVKPEILDDLIDALAQAREAARGEGLL